MTIHADQNSNESRRREDDDDSDDDNVKEGNSAIDGQQSSIGAAGDSDAGDGNQTLGEYGEQIEPDMGAHSQNGDPVGVVVAEPNSHVVKLEKECEMLRSKLNNLNKRLGDEEIVASSDEDATVSDRSLSSPTNTRDPHIDYTFASTYYYMTDVIVCLFECNDWP